jgi:hypothetical protein
LKFTKETAMGYRELPEVQSTIEDRVIALRTAKSVLAATTPISSSAVADVLDLIRVAEYITVGHDYIDTHPDGEEITTLTPCVTAEDDDRPVWNDESVRLDTDDDQTDNHED